MRLYSCKAGLSWVLVRATNADEARRTIGERLGYTYKPWLWRTIDVRPATGDDITRYGALADAQRPAPKPGEKRRTPTAQRLAGDVA